MTPLSGFRASGPCREADAGNRAGTRFDLLHIFVIQRLWLLMTFLLFSANLYSEAASGGCWR